MLGEKLGEFGMVLHPVQQHLLQDAPAGKANGVAAQRGQVGTTCDGVIAEAGKQGVPLALLIQKTGFQAVESGKLVGGKVGGLLAGFEGGAVAVVGAEEMAEGSVAGGKNGRFCHLFHQLQQPMGGMPMIGEQGLVMGLHGHGEIIWWGMGADKRPFVSARRIGMITLFDQNFIAQSD